VLFPGSRSLIRDLHEGCFGSWGLAWRELADELAGTPLVWELTWPSGVRVRYSLGDDAPYGAPEIRIIEPADAPTRWQNVELDGTVCLLPPGVRVMPLLHPAAVDRVLSALAEIIRVNLEDPGGGGDSVAARHRWVEGRVHAWSLLDLDEKPDKAVAAELEERWIIAPSAEYLDAWVRHCERGVEYVDVLVLRVQGFDDVPSQPDEFRADARATVERGGLVLYDVPTEGGPLLVAAALEPSGAVVRLRVDRADRRWIHERGGRGLDPRVSGAHVTLVGCGSLGAGVAELLGRAGVGRLTLIDPEPLTWDNVARHALGGEAVGRYKATELARRLRAHLPTLPRVDGVPRPWQAVATEQPDALRTDLLVCTMATWPGDLALAEWARDHGTSLVVGWLEPHAVAGHAVSLFGQCLGCHFTPTGMFRREVARWDENPVRLADGCHEQYYPYGYADVVGVQSLIARLALECLTGQLTQPTHWAVVLSPRALSELGARPSPETVHLYRELPPTAAWVEHRQPWPRNPKCWHCHATNR
jgi:hypothetical protein